MTQDVSIQAVGTAYFIANLTLAMILVYARATRRVYPGFNEWVWSQIVLAAGIVLLAAAGQRSPWLAFVVGNGFIMLAQVFVYSGCLRFFDLRGYRRWPYFAFVLIAVATFAWLVGTDGSASHRSLVFSVFTSVMMGRTIVALVAHRIHRTERSALLLMAGALLAMVFFFFRAMILWYVGAGDELWNDRLMAAAFYVGIVFSTLLVFGFLQLVQARTEAELQVAQAQAEALANRDTLTGVWNRRRFENEAVREIVRATRHDHPLSLIAFDVDRFKTINDRHGHQAGDEVLVEICKLVHHRIRSTDALIRWGGDEFLIMCCMTSAAGAETLARGLRADMASTMFGAAGKVTLSIGIAQYQPGESLQAWLARADRGVYAVKSQGRDQVVIEEANKNNWDEKPGRRRTKQGQVHLSRGGG